MMHTDLEIVGERLVVEIILVEKEFCSKEAFSCKVTATYYFVRVSLRKQLVAKRLSLLAEHVVQFC